MRKLIFMVLLVATGAFAQSPTEQYVLVTAQHKDHRPFEQLQPADLKVQDGATILSVSPTKDVGISYAFVLDASNSVRNTGKDERDAAKVLIEDLMRKDLDSGELIAFDRTMEVVQPSTSNPEELVQKIPDIRFGGGSAMNDALYFAASRMQGGAALNRPRVLIVITDGVDNQSVVTRRELLTALLKARVRVYALVLERTPQQSAIDTLAEITKATGGKALHLNATKLQSTAAAAEIAAGIAAEVTNWWKISFQTPHVKDKKLKEKDVPFRSANPDILLQSQTSYLPGQ